MEKLIKKLTKMKGYTEKVIHKREQKYDLKLEKWDENKSADYLQTTLSMQALVEQLNDTILFIKHQFT